MKKAMKVLATKRVLKDIRESGCYITVSGNLDHLATRRRSHTATSQSQSHHTIINHVA